MSKTKITDPEADRGDTLRSRVMVTEDGWTLLRLRKEEAALLFEHGCSYATDPPEWDVLRLKPVYGTEPAAKERLSDVLDAAIEGAGKALFPNSIDTTGEPL